MSRLSNRVALITGAANGIGKASSLLFAKEGASVVVVDVDRENGEAVAEQIRSGGGKATYLFADVSSDTDCRNMIEHAKSTFGALHVLFNNAGIMDPADGDSASTTEEIYNKTMDINVKGVFLGCKHGIPRPGA